MDPNREVNPMKELSDESARAVEVTLTIFAYIADRRFAYKSQLTTIQQEG